MSEIKLVISDIDRTLIMNREDFPVQVVAAVKKLSQRGIGFTFASGRLPYMIDPYAKQMELDLPIIACSGGLVYHGDKMLEKHSLKVSSLQCLIKKADALDMTVLYSLNSMEYCLRETEGALRKKAERGYYHPLRPIANDEWQTMQIDKMIILDDTGKKQAALLSEEEKKVEGTINFTHYSSAALEITVGGVNKATGIQTVCNYLNIAPQQVMAIGDNENDLEMLKFAGVGVAVANAQAYLKDIADYVCENSGADGVVEAIEKFCI